MKGRIIPAFFVVRVKSIKESGNVLRRSRVSKVLYGVGLGVSGGPGRTRSTIITCPGRTCPAFGGGATGSTFAAFFLNHGHSDG